MIFGITIVFPLQEEIGERMGWSLTENISELVSNDPEQVIQC